MERAGGEAGAPTRAPAAAAAAGGGMAKAKSCKGCLYYSSVLRSQARGPVCVGITRDIPKESGLTLYVLGFPVVRNHANDGTLVGYVALFSERMIGQIELEALQAGRKLSDFKYGCVGYSIYLDDKETSTGLREKKPHSQLPACIGVEEAVSVRHNGLFHVSMEVLATQKSESVEKHELSFVLTSYNTSAQLLFCIFVETFQLLSDRKHHPDKGAPAYHKKEDPAAPTYHNKEAPQPHQHKPGTPRPHQHKPGPPQPHRHKPGHMGDGFLSKFQRNARLVANGVAKNMNKVGTYIKDTVGDMMDKRPK
ncbi:hypothetical protein U9M48_026219 [Paspalum notatum var. saurae]|uniref:DUF8204 domain-containing protein n=1 Tax=Paspalum notatum var. saurae TaxID=547442 RepID=A0AAQ3WXW7_PASNO